MCYDIKANLEHQLLRALRSGNEKAYFEIRQKLDDLGVNDYYHVSGYQHPTLIIYTNEEPYKPVLAKWGLIPFWVKDRKQAEQIWNQTLNARGESIFEKPSFRESAKHKRCLIYVDGFYEHHHHKSKTYPYYIHLKNDEPIALAGLWSEWTDKETGEILTTFSIVTTVGNDMMAKIHNNPKLAGPRMPLILPEEFTDRWLIPLNDELDKKTLQELIQSYPEEELDAYTVHKLRGKQYIGNVKEINEKVVYPELESQLF